MAAENILDIPDEKFRIIGIDEDAGELPSRKRISYWQDAWRRFRENKIALVAAVILVLLIFFIIRDQAQHTGSGQIPWAAICLPGYGRRAVFPL